MATIADRGLPGADGLSGAHERCRRCDPADLLADALRHLHAAGGPGGGFHLLAGRHQPRNDEHDRAGTAVRHGNHHGRDPHGVVPAGHGSEWIGLRHQRLSVVRAASCWW